MKNYYFIILSILFFLKTPAYCWPFNNATIYKEPYGALYYRYVVNSGKLFTKGWHIPSDSEWTTLISY